MGEKIYQPRGIIPYEQSSKKDIDFSKSPREIIKETIGDDPNRRLYSEKQFELFKKEKWFREDGWFVYELKKHEITEEIPTFRGWTPSYDFVASEFKLEDDIGLVNIGKEVKLSKKPGNYLVGENVREVSASELQYGRRFAGTKELFEKNKYKIEQTFSRLNCSNIEFIVFRTYRGWPAVWDDLYFFSKGDFNDA
ncbi:hypothetical protein J4230_04580 [Candidatus Woesearchaeota archaeon]|nr:hypothetical protein [Candidatus Woesearchaeota archaeon]